MPSSWASPDSPDGCISPLSFRTVWAAAGSVDTDLSFLSFLKVYRTDVAHRRMASRRVVEPLDVTKTSARACSLDRYTFLAVRSVFSELKKLSIAELSQTSPARLMLQVMPWSLSNSWKCSLGYWADSTCRRNTGLLTGF